MTRWWRRLPTQPRLRDRVALGFAVLALLLSSVVALVAWTFASHYLNRDHTLAARAEVADNALLVDAEIAEGTPPGNGVLDRLQYPPGTAAVLVDDGRVYGNRAAAGLDLPGDLAAQVGRNRHSTGEVTVAGEPYLEIVRPMHDPARAYAEFRPLAELHHTLTRTWLLLVGAGIVTTLLGAGVGRVASRRLLRPVSDVARAASAVAHGDLSVRLPRHGDPDLDEIATSFNRTVGEYEDRVLADARFADDVSHELRTPLTTMLNSLSLLENRRDQLPCETREPLDLLSQDLHRFRALVVDLLEISRVDEGDTAGREEPVVLAELVTRAADAAAGRAVTEVEPGAQGLVVHADKRRLERVIVNLVHNAETHGRGCRRVAVSAGDRSVRIEVDDDGPGVPEERRERVFDRFARGSHESSGGTGLGLAIAARHVRLNGGTISVETAPGGGARFVVQLPTDKHLRDLPGTRDPAPGPGLIHLRPT